MSKDIYRGNLTLGNIREMAHILADLYESGKYDHWTTQFIASNTLLEIPEQYQEAFEEIIDTRGVQEMFES